MHEHFVTADNYYYIPLLLNSQLYIVEYGELRYVWSHVDINDLAMLYIVTSWSWTR